MIHKSSPGQDTPGQVRSPEISLETLEAIKAVWWRDQLDSLTRYIRDNHPLLVNQNPTFYVWLEETCRQAQVQGFTKETDLLHYLNIIGLLGEEALQQTSAYPEIYQLVTQNTLSPSQRIEQASDLATQIAQPPFQASRNT